MIHARGACHHAAASFGNAWFGLVAPVGTPECVLGKLASSLYRWKKFDDVHFCGVAEGFSGSETRMAFNVAPMIEHESS